MGKLIISVAVTVLAVALSAGAAFATVKHGTNQGEALHGTRKSDTVYAYGGADVLWGGNEAGWGDKVLGGSADVTMLAGMAATAEGTERWSRQ